MSKSRRVVANRKAQTGTLVGVRLQPDQLTALDSWIKQQSGPRPTRPEAVWRILSSVLPFSGGTLDQQIERAERKLSGGQKVTGERSPEQGMAMLRKGAAENKLRSLKERRRRDAGESE